MNNFAREQHISLLLRVGSYGDEICEKVESSSTMKEKQTAQREAPITSEKWL